MEGKVYRTLKECEELLVFYLTIQERDQDEYSSKRIIELNAQIRILKSLVKE